MYLLNGGTLKRAQAITVHESPRTTKLYDRTPDEAPVEDIEKIGSGGATRICYSLGTRSAGATLAVSLSGRSW